MQPTVEEERFPAKVTVIGCGVLRPDLTAIASQLGLALEFRFLPGGLHNRPDELRRRLQEAIDQASEDPECCRIVVGYGLCGMGTVNIQARRVPLVIPRVHDCIALFLGGDAAYREQFASEPGTYYISSGWFNEQVRDAPAGEQVWVGKESMGSGQLVDRYGEKTAGRLVDFFSNWQKNYRRAAFIDTGLPGSTAGTRHARALAERHHWQFVVLRGDPGLLSALLTAESSTDALLVVAPGYTTRHDGATNMLAAAPAGNQHDANLRGPRCFTLGKTAAPRFNVCYGLGIDAGGTYTDVVIFDFLSSTIVAKHKALTTRHQFSLGIDAALAGLPPELLARAELVAVSTTLATNAIVEGEGQPTALLVMAGANPAKELFPHRPTVFIAGRLNMDGRQLEPVDERQVREVVRTLVGRDGVSGFAVSGFAGAINPQHELEVKRIIQEETDCQVCCGHELSDQLNLTVRAQTAVLNARIIPRMLCFFEDLATTLAGRGITAPVMVVKGDGTLMSAAMAREKPVETVLSGPAASVAGARFLTGSTDAIVVDMGGTTTDTAAISKGQVALCEEGAKVGSHRTHVKALAMRTSGLGGDSLIVVGHGQLRIGPRRVVPLVVAAAMAGEKVVQAIDRLAGRLQRRPHLALPQQLLIATMATPGFARNSSEEQILHSLGRHPQSLDELAEAIGAVSHRFLPLERLEQHGLIQRCGLTPTDLLHVSGRFDRWPAAAARQWLRLLEPLTGRTAETLTEELLERIELELARELLKKQLDDETAIDSLADCSLCRYLTNKLLSLQSDGLRLQVKMSRPIIGIGAPIGHFLPQAALRLGARAIIPEHAEVANAIGAITSRIRLRRQLHLRPDDRGRFLIEGIAGTRSFARLDEAEQLAIEHLQHHLLTLARSAGTSTSTITFSIDDHTAPLAGGQNLFLGRTIEGTLEGLPDLLLGGTSAADFRPPPRKSC